MTSSVLADRFTQEGWQFRVLPRAKGLSLAEAFGFVAGDPAGQGEGRGFKTPPVRWRSGQAELLPAGPHKNLKLRAASGVWAAGFWELGASGKTGALAWHARDGAGELHLVDLHPEGYSTSIAMGCGGGAQVGSGTPKVKKGQPAVEVGLVWRGRADDVEVLDGGGGEVTVNATDGEQHVGSVSATRAALWQGNKLVLLGPPGKATTAVAVGGGEQVGEVWGKLGPQAVMWRGSEASLQLLHPPGFETSHAMGCAGGLQVGMVKEQERTKAGFNAPATRAMLWAGAGQWLDLHAMVPAPWNASVARAIAVDGDLVRVAGCVEEFVFHGDAPSIGARQACVWQARLR